MVALVQRQEIFLRILLILLHLYKKMEILYQTYCLLSILYVAKVVEALGATKTSGQVAVG